MDTSAPHPVPRLVSIPGIGTSLARKLAAQGIETPDQLRAAFRAGTTDILPQETRAFLKWNIVRGYPLQVGQRIADELRRRLRFDIGAGRSLRFPVFSVGSIRRRSPYLKDIDLLVVVPERFGDSWARVLDRVVLAAAGRDDRCEVVDAYARGKRRYSFVVRCGGSAYGVDLFLALASEKPFALFHHTGSAVYNIRTRAHAKKRGWKLNQYGLFSAATGHRVRGSSAIKTERDLAKFLGVSFRPPSGRGEPK